MKYHVLFILLLTGTLCIRSENILRQTDIRSLGMGANGVTQSVWFNPALIAVQADKQIQLAYYNPYEVKELGILGTSFICPNRYLSIGLQLSTFGYDDYRQNMGRISLSKQLSEQWSLGIAVQYSFLQTILTDEVPQTLSTDIGLLYKPVESLLIGVLMMNYPSFSIQQTILDNKELTNYIIQVGFQWQVINDLLIAVTAVSDQSYPIIGQMGIEYSPFTHFQVRAGFQTTPFQPSLGVGYRVGRFSIDCMARYHNILGISPGVGLCFIF